MVKQAASIDGLIEAFSKLPGIGRKTASRLAFHILRASTEEAEELARRIMEVKEAIHLCSECFNLTDQDPCPICRDDRRIADQICVVEEPNDLLAIEGTGAFVNAGGILQSACEIDYTWEPGVIPTPGVDPIREEIHYTSNGMVRGIDLLE